MEATWILHAFDALDGKNLRQVYSMYVEMTSLDLFGSAWNKELELAMNNHVTRLASLSDDEIRLQLVLQLLQTTNQRAVHIEETQELELAYARILGATGETSIEPLIERFFQQLLEDTEHQWQHLKPIERSHIAKVLFDYSATFSADIREQVQQGLGMRQMTSHHLEQALTERGVAQGIEQLYQQFSMNIIPLVVNSVIDIKKIDVPLGFFTLATSENAIAAVSSSFLTYRIANKSMKREMIPAILVQAVLPYILAGKPTVAPHLQTYSAQIATHYQTLKKALQQLETQQQEAQLDIKMLTDMTAILKDKLQQERVHLLEAADALYLRLEKTAQLPDVAPYTQNVESLRQDIERLQRLQDTTVMNQSLFDKVKAATKKLEHRTKMKTKERALSKELEKMAISMLQQQIPFDETLQLPYTAAKQQTISLQQEQKLVTEKLAQRAEKMHTILVQYEKLEKQVFELETRYSHLRTL